MKLIETNEIPTAGIQILASIGGASVADANYPLVNILDTHPKKVAKATAAAAVITIPMTGASSSVAIFNTNAAVVTIEILNNEGGVHATFTKDLAGARNYYQLITRRAIPELKSWMVTYPYYAGLTHKVNIYLSEPTHGDTVVSVGVVFAGVHSEYDNPEKGITKSFKDSSVISELNSGATYVLKRPMVRTFDFNLHMCDVSGDPLRLEEMFLRLGPDPVPWMISDTNEDQWLVFARKDGEPSSIDNAYRRVKSSVKLVEVL